MAAHSGMTVGIIDIPMGCGGGTRGAAHGPDAMRREGIAEALARLGHRVVDHGTISGWHARPAHHANPGLKALDEVVAAAEMIRVRIADLPADETPVILGGDHAVALGTLPGLLDRAARLGRPLFVLWLDAHPDCHTALTSESGHLHGTPVAHAMGAEGFAPAFSRPRHVLSPQNLLMLGIRSVDDAEADFLNRQGIASHGPDSIRLLGIESILASFLARIRAENGLLHVSFDADVLDPELVPGVGTPVADGLTAFEMRRILEIVGASGSLASLEIVEVNPSLDPAGRTARLVTTLATDAFRQSQGNPEIPIMGTLIPQATRPGPSALSLVPFVSVDQMMKLVLARGIERVLTELAGEIEADFRRWQQFDKTPRLAAHSTGGVIELMPTADDRLYAFKYVNGHPGNAAAGRQTVAAFGVLADVATGYPILFTEMTILTALRTAAMSALAARYLARPDSAVMAIIGNGAQAEFQALAFRAILGIRRLRLHDVDRRASEKCRQNLAPLGFEITIAESAEACVAGADIITTATADKRNATILTDNMIGSGVHINGVGGDCPGKTELHPDILRRATIFVEHTPQTRVEGDIQQLPADHPVTELWQVMTGAAAGRTCAGEITVFDSVGFAIEDFAALRYVHETLLPGGQATTLDLIADPDEPRDLFGMLMRAA